MIFSNLNLNSTEPIYYQIEQHIKKTIENGILSSNSKLPATRELAKIIGVSRNSVITAYENLELEGILYTVKGKGTFVADKNITSKVNGILIGQIKVMNMQIFLAALIL